MTSNGKKGEAKSEGPWHYRAVKKLSASLRGVKTKNNDNFSCLNCLCSSRTKNKLESQKKSMQK